MKRILLSVAAVSGAVLLLFWVGPNLRNEHANPATAVPSPTTSVRGSSPPLTAEGGETSPAPATVAAIGPDAQLAMSLRSVMSPLPAELRAGLVRDRRSALRFSFQQTNQPDVSVTITALTDSTQLPTATVVFGIVDGQPGSLVRLDFHGDSVVGWLQRPDVHEGIQFESDGSGRSRFSVYALHHALRCAVCDQALKSAAVAGADR